MLVIKKLYNIQPRNALLTINKSFVRLHLYYDDIVYDQPNNQSFGTKSKRFSTMLPFQLQTQSKQLLDACKYLYKQISLKNSAYDTRSTHSVGTYYCRSFIQYVRKISRKTNISYPLIRIRTLENVVYTFFFVYLIDLKKKLLQHQSLLRCSLRFLSVKKWQVYLGNP